MTEHYAEKFLEKRKQGTKRKHHETVNDKMRNERQSNSVSTHKPTSHNLDETHESVAPAKKKKRGPTRMNVVATRQSDRPEVEYNERNQPIGKASVELSSTIGIIVREIVPIDIRCWKDVDANTKEMLWILVKQKFQINETRKDGTLSRMRKLWVDHKSRLSRQIRKVSKLHNAKRKLKLLKPETVKDDEWKRFVKNRLSAEWKAKSRRFRRLRKSQKLPHTTSRKGYARLEDEMRMETQVPSSVSRVDVWIKGHLQKNGNPINDAVGESMKKLDDYAKKSTQDSTSINGDALTQLFGPERAGWVRGMGFGVTPSKVSAQVQNNTQIRKLEDEITQLRDVIANLQENMLIFGRRFTMEHNDYGEDGMHNSTPIQQPQEHNDYGGDDMHNSTPTQQPQQAKGDSIDVPNTLKEGAICKLLDWSGSGELVGKAELATIDCDTLVHHVKLGPDNYKVWVIEVMVPTLPLPRPTQEFFTLVDAKGSTVAWPKKYVTFD